MRPQIRRGAPGAAVLAALVLVPSAAHAARPVPVDGGPRGWVQAVSPDGTTVAADGGRKAGVQAVTVDDTGKATSTVPLGGGDGGSIVVDAASDGSAAIAGPALGNGNLLLAVRAPGGAFGRFSAFTPDAAPNVASSVATAGGHVLAGGVVDQSAGSTPVVLRRRPDGTIALKVALPGAPGGVSDDPDVQVGVDAAGRGIALWQTGTGAARRTQAVTIAADGTLGAVQVLPGAPGTTAPADQPTGMQVRLAADGTGAVSWRSDGHTRVAPATTTAGVDAGAAADVALRGSTAIQPDGAAVVVSATRSGGAVRARVASRPAGRPFSSVRTVQGVAGGPVSVAMQGGRWAATFANEPSGSVVHKSSLLRGTAGGAPAKLLGLPTASISQLNGLQVALPGGRTVVFARANRQLERSNGAVSTTGVRTETFRVGDGRPRAARASFTLARRQSLGKPQVLRTTIRCSTACSYRVVGAVGREGRFDVARTVSKGTHRVRVPYQGNSGSRATTTPPLRRAATTRVTIAVDDAAGGETVWRRSVRVRP